MSADERRVDVEETYPQAYGVESWEVMRRAPHLGHMHHLCDMANRGVALKVVKKLVKKPKFICKNCGRAAAKEENLCEPVPL
jgi:hypothetical protein